MLIRLEGFLRQNDIKLQVQTLKIMIIEYCLLQNLILKLNDINDEIKIYQSIGG
jgi:hypothetical protein